MPGVSLPLRCAGGLSGVCVAACGAAFLALLLSWTGCSAGVQGVPREEPFTVETAVAKTGRLMERSLRNMGGYFPPLTRMPSGNRAGSANSGQAEAVR